MLQQKHLSGAAHPPLFPATHTVRRTAKAQTPTVANFDKHQASGVEHDQVNFAGSGAVVALQMNQALVLQKTAGCLFNSGAAFAAAQSVLALAAAGVICPLRFI